MKIELRDGDRVAVFEMTDAAEQVWAQLGAPPAEITVSADGQTITADGKIIGRRCDQ